MNKSILFLQLLLSSGLFLGATSSQPIQLMVHRSWSDSILCQTWILPVDLTMVHLGVDLVLHCLPASRSVDGDRYRSWVNSTDLTMATSSIKILVHEGRRWTMKKMNRWRTWWSVGTVKSSQIERTCVASSTPSFSGRESSPIWLQPVDASRLNVHGRWYIDQMYRWSSPSIGILYKDQIGDLGAVHLLLYLYLLLLPFAAVVLYLPLFAMLYMMVPVLFFLPSVTCSAGAFRTPEYIPRSALHFYLFHVWQSIQEQSWKLSIFCYLSFAIACLPLPYIFFFSLVHLHVHREVQRSIPLLLLSNTFMIYLNRTSDDILHERYMAWTYMNGTWHGACT